MVVNPVLQAQDNLKEADRQLEQAKQQFARGRIPKSRLDQLARLRDAASEDVRRTLKEFGPLKPDEETLGGGPFAI